ncbi:MAG: hypothetical protein SNJ78_10490 [Spirochaetales bacterium]
MKEQNKDSIACYEELVQEVKALPDHTREEIESAAHHLEMLHYQNLLDGVDKNFIRYTKAQVLQKLQEIITADVGILPAQATVVEEWDRRDLNPEVNRRRRMELIVREYKKLCRLRSNEAEAWDEINELYYDD